MTNWKIRVMSSSTHCHGLGETGLLTSHLQQVDHQYYGYQLIMMIERSLWV
jgi:hypothetical protein